MNGPGKSDRPVVPGKSPNKAGQPAAEGMEGRGLAEGSSHQQNAPRAQHRDGAPSALERVRQAAVRNRKQQFTTLLHHVYNPECTPGGVLRAQARRQPGRGRRDVAALRRGSGGQPPRPLRAPQAGSVPGQAGSQSVHPEGRRAATAARCDRAGGQDCPARDGRRVERHLRNGPATFPQIAAPVERLPSLPAVLGGGRFCIRSSQPVSRRWASSSNATSTVQAPAPTTPRRRPREQPDAGGTAAASRSARCPRVVCEQLAQAQISRSSTICSPHRASVTAERRGEPRCREAR
jgi:hypothetical protein